MYAFYDSELEYDVCVCVVIIDVNNISYYIFLLNKIYITDYIFITRLTPFVSSSHFFLQFPFLLFTSRAPLFVSKYLSRALTSMHIRFEGEKRIFFVIRKKKDELSNSIFIGLIFNAREYFFFLQIVLLIFFRYHY